MKTSFTNPTPFIIAAIIVALGAYWYFFMGSGNDAPLTASAENPAQTRFKLLVSELQPITFRTDIFSDPRFVGLVDLSTPLVPESPGRLDPFAPIPGVKVES